MNDSEKQTIVFIPRNFIEKGTFMGGMFKIRNAIEGGILAVLIAVPVIQLPLSLTVRIIILCMTALPAAMISLIGIGGESISAFLMNALRFLKNRRVIYRIDVNPDPKNKHRIKKPRNKEPKAKKHKHPKKKSTASMTASGQSDKYEDCVSDEISSHDVAISKKKERRQFDTSTKRGIRKQAREDIRILKYENRQLKKAQKQAKRAVRTELKRQKQEEKRRVREENRQKKAEIKATKQADKEREHPASDMNTAPASSKPKKKKRKDMTLEDYLPIEKIANGVIYTTDHRYVKILEIEPINFLLRSTREQQSIIFSFISYLKISPVKLQIKMISKKADINKHLNQAQLELERETDPNCRQLQKDYIQFVRRLSSREAVSRRFFLIFEYEPFNVNRKVEETEILAALETAAQTAKTFLYQCGNEVVSHDNEDEFTTDVLYTLLNRTKSTEVPLPKRINQVLTRYEETGREAEMDAIHINEFIAPESVDFKHSNYVLINGVYHAYLLVPSDGYKPKVAPGWLSLLINAGEGIDVDFYLHKQPKDKIQQRLGQQIRINRSKIKDASDTNADFDDLDSAIRSGYFLKQGLSNNEDFYYMNLLITITANNLEELQWRIQEMKKLLISQDMDLRSCYFLQEQGFLSSLPLVSLDKKLYELSKRNTLTTGAASCYPFVSSTEEKALPVGHYRIEETQAPTGYLKDGAKTLEFEITKDGEMVDLTSKDTSIANQVIRGGVKVQKRDIETGETKPQGNATLEGATFTITNLSTHPVLVNEKLYESGQVVLTLKTDKSGAAATAKDALPYGHYRIDETEAPDGYLNEGKLSQEFDIQENGKIIDLTSKEHAILNQIIRGDLEFVKVSDGDLNRLANVPFSITSKTTGESHTIVTDKNGYASTSAEWNKHTANTNRGENHRCF